MIRFKRALLVCLAPAQLFLMGCGGTSQDEMRAHAIRRVTDDEVSEVKTQAADVAAVVEVPASASSTPPAATPPVSHAAASKPSPAQQTPSDRTATNTDAVARPVDAAPVATPFAEPLSPTDARQRTASNLTAIALAWNSYLRQHGYFPGPITNATKEPLLSWRVELLPNLGLQSLYEEFHLDEAWDSPHNITLLDKIPSVYQSPERFDAKTNYLALAQGTTTVYQERRKVPESLVEDGIDNTLALLEADDERAVPWTQPAEFELVAATPLISLGKLRQNGFFAVWSSGKPSWIDDTVDPKLFAKACSIDAGDGFRGSQIANDLAAGLAIPVAEPTSGVAAVALPADASDSRPTGEIAATPQTTRPTLNAAQSSLKAQRETVSQELYDKAPIPSPPELKVARDLFRDLYQAEYAAAKSEQQRSQLARQMLDHLPDLGGDLAGQYALLEIAKQIAVQSGDVELALDAMDQLTARFEFDDDTLLDTFEKLARTAKDGRAQDRLLEEAEVAFDGFVLTGEFEAAERISQLAVTAASKIRDERAVGKFALRKQWAIEAKALQKAADEGLVTLDTNPQDPRANGDVGKFLCLVKGDWENGLVILANGHDRSLRRLAEMELGASSDSIKKLELADLWWREAEFARPVFQATMHARAKHWYEQALPGLAAGLVRIRVERRIEEIAKSRFESS